MTATLSRLRPVRALPGGRVRVEGESLLGSQAVAPRVMVGDHSAHIVMASNEAVTLQVPPECPGGTHLLRLSTVPGGSLLLHVGHRIASGVHQVDNPAVDSRGRVYVTYSGSRGEQAPVSVFRLGSGGLRDALVTGITNATALACDPQDRLHVSSRFDGTVYRIDEDGRADVLASDLGVACGLAFAPDGTLFVGDRSGTVFRVLPDGKTHVHASLPPSVAAFHLALGSDGTLFVAAPTVAPVDKIYRIEPDGSVHIHRDGFGRPQGLAISPEGDLHVVEALAGASGVYRLRDHTPPDLVVSGPDLIGMAFRPDKGMVVATSDEVFGLDPLPLLS